MSGKAGLYYSVNCADRLHQMLKTSFSFIRVIRVFRG